MQRLLKKIMIILLLFVYALIFGEFYIRIFRPTAMLPRFICSTPFGIRGNMPKQSYWHTTSDYRINIRTNAQGFRADEEIPVEKPAGVKRIVVLGDSFGLGYEVDLQDSSLEVMRRALAAKGINCQIVNLSVSGYGNAEELIRLKKEGLRYRPDLVLVYWHMTDLEDNIRSGLFEFKDKTVKQISETYLPAVKIAEMLYSMPFYRWLEQNCQLYTWMRENATLRIKDLVVEAKDAERTGGLEKKDEETGYANRLTLALLNELKQTANQAGSKFLVLDIPKRVSIWEYNSQFPLPQEDVPRDFVTVSPLPLFEQHKGELIYWERSHHHWTPKGCKMVGEMLAEYIVENKLL